MNKRLIPLLAFALITIGCANTDSTPFAPASVHSPAAIDSSSELLSALALAQTPANWTDPAAVYEAAITIGENDPTPEQQRLAVALMTYAARQGVADAMYELTRIYEEGLGVPVDHVKAIDWHRMYQQKQANSAAQVSFYQPSNGELSPQTAVDVVSELRKAAEGGDSESQRRLASMHDSGMHTPQSDEKAFYWYQQAAKQGDDLSQVMTAYFYCRGIAITQNTERANHWLALSGRDFTCTNEKE